MLEILANVGPTLTKHLVILNYKASLYNVSKNQVCFYPKVKQWNLQYVQYGQCGEGGGRLCLGGLFLLLQQKERKKVWGRRRERGAPLLSLSLHIPWRRPALSLSLSHFLQRPAFNHFEVLPPPPPSLYLYLHRVGQKLGTYQD